MRTVENERHDNHTFKNLPSNTDLLGFDQAIISKTQNITPLLQQLSLTVPLQKPPTILCLPLPSEIFLLPKTPKNPPSQKCVTLLLSNHPTLSNSLALSQTPPIKSSLLRFSLSCPPRLQEKF